MRWLTGILIVLLLPASAAAATEATFVSEPGESLGQGKTYRVDGAAFAAWGYPWQIQGGFQIPGECCTGSLRFVPPLGERLRSGTTYPNAVRAPFQGTGAGLDVTLGNGKGCSQNTGRFTIERVSYYKGRLRSLTLSFEQHCEGKPEALRGTIHYHAGEKSPPRPSPQKAPLVRGALEESKLRVDAVRAQFLQAPNRANTTRYRNEIDPFVTVLSDAQPRDAALPAARRVAKALKSYQRALKRGDAGAQARALAKIKA